MQALFYQLEESIVQAEEALAITLLEGANLIEAKPLSAQVKRPNGEPLDKPVLELLSKQRRLLSPPYSYLIPRTEVTILLKHLAATGRFSAEGKSLTCDFFTQGELYFLIQSPPSAPITVTAQVRCGKREFLLSEATLLIPGQPIWLKIGSFLYMLKADCSWQRLKSLWSQPSVIIDAEWQEWLSEQPERLIGNVDALLKRSSAYFESTPRLLLKDRVGAFANLQMDYGSYGCVSYPLQPNETLAGFKRNTSAEHAWEKDLLETDYQIKPVGTTRYYCPVDKIAKSLAFLLELGWQVQDAFGNAVRRHTSVDFAGSLSENRVVIQGGVSYGEFQADVSKLAGAFNRREQFVQLGAGVVGLLPENLDKQTVCTLAEEGEFQAKGYALPKSALGLVQELEAVGTFQASKQLQQLLDTLKNPTILEPVATTRFQGTLRPYQSLGVQWMQALYANELHGLLADEMGLGKTVQVLAFLASLPIEKGPSLIVMPTSLLFNWRYELERFTPDIPHQIHHGPERARILSGLLTDGVILTSYATLRLDLDLLRQMHWHCVILDESQAIKNPQSQTAQALFSLHSDFRLSLTGTPIENRLEELWSQFRFLMPTLLGSLTQFQARLQAIANGTQELKRLKKSIAPFLLRRKKEEVATELPPKTEQTLLIEMPESQRAVYEDFLAGVRGNLFKKVSQEGVEKHRMEILEAILRLRQLCCHPLLALPSLEGEVVSGKLDVLLEELSILVAEGRKVLIFSQFASMLHLIKRSCVEQGWNVLLLEGGTKDRERLVQQFQEDPTYPIFLISLKAGGVGLNLTAADTVILFDPWWNVAAENQAIDRAHRIGQDKPLLVKRYLMAESIEEKVSKLKEAKREISQELLEEIPSPQAVNIDELLALLTD